MPKLSGVCRAGTLVDGLVCCSRAVSHAGLLEFKLLSVRVSLMRHPGPGCMVLAAVLITGCCRAALCQTPEVSPLRSSAVYEALQLANDAVAKGDFEAATQHFTAALEAARAFEPSAQDFVAEAIARRSERRLDEARQLIERALQIAPDDPTLYRSLGIIEEESEYFHDARDAYIKALRLQPDDVEAAMYLWSLYSQRLRDFPHAVQIFTELTQASPMRGWKSFSSTW
jgi:tetratricopeptide (TPR) repeat protein